MMIKLGILLKLLCSDLHQSKNFHTQVDQVVLLEAWSITKHFSANRMSDLKCIDVLLRVIRSFEYVSSQIMHYFPYSGCTGLRSDK